MEQTDNIFGMLDLMIRPAFCVKDGTIVYTNEAARSHMVPEGAAIEPLIASGKTAYAEFTGGCLYLNLCISGNTCGASVKQLSGYHIFTLDDEDTQAHLQAMALAAQQLREPLTSLMTSADRLASTAGQDEASQEQLARLSRGLYQMQRLVSNMSDAANFSSSVISCKQVHDAQLVFSELFQKISALLAHTQITLQFTNLSTPLYCLMDIQQIERAVYNIISNAIKFTPDGGMIDAKVSKSGNRLILTVTDTGSGIPEELRGSIFSRYLREPAIEDGRRGIGLGMVLIRSAATAHGGAVLIDQPGEKGTRITMTMVIGQGKECQMHSPILMVDYAGERDHALMELSDKLPASAFRRG